MASWNARLQQMDQREILVCQDNHKLECSSHAGTFANAEGNFGEIKAMRRRRCVTAISKSEKKGWPSMNAELNTPQHHLFSKRPHPLKA